MKNVPSNLSNLKSKVDKTDVYKSVTVPVDLNKLSGAVKNDVLKKNIYNAKIKNIEDNILDISNLTSNTILEAEINELKKRNTYYY